jgi:hypothetical protein
LPKSRAVAAVGNSAYHGPWELFQGYAVRTVYGNRLRWGGGLACALGACLLAGCGRSEQAKSRELEASNLKPLGIFYGRFIGQHGGQPPANEAEFRAFVKSLGKDELATFGISDADRLFISPRDGKPYVILYGPVSGPPGPAGSPVVAYEQEGQWGKRFVASAMYSTAWAIAATAK